MGNNETTPIYIDSLLFEFIKPSESRISETTYWAEVGARKDILGRGRSTERHIGQRSEQGKTYWAEVGARKASFYGNTQRINCIKIMGRSITFL